MPLPARTAAMRALRLGQALVLQICAGGLWVGAQLHTYRSRARTHSSPSNPSRTASWRAVLLYLHGRNQQCSYSEGNHPGT